MPSLAMILLPAAVHPGSNGYLQNQEQPEAPVRFSEIVDRAFAFPSGTPAEYKRVASRIVIRFLPSSGQTEWQLVFVKGLNGSLRVFRYSVSPGSSSIVNQYNKNLKLNPKMTLREILESIHVEKNELQVTAKITSAVEDLYHVSLPTNMSTEVCLDGATYEFWIQTPSNEIHASLSSCAYGKGTGSSPLFLWVKNIEAE